VSADRPTRPFSCRHTLELPELLAELDCPVAVSTDQAGKVHDSTFRRALATPDQTGWGTPPEDRQR
jgi:hypothetical protein